MMEGEGEEPNGKGVAAEGRQTKMNLHSFYGREVGFYDKFDPDDCMYVIVWLSNRKEISMRTKTVNLLGQNLSSEISCSAARTHYLDLVSAEAIMAAVIGTVDGELMTKYQRSFRPQ